MKPGLRWGVYGGAFDPPHNAHVALARAAVDQLGLDELRIFPTGGAWHRSARLTPADHRLAMSRLAFADVASAQVDDREIRRAGPTYTIDTLRELQREIPGGGGEPQLFLVIGADQLQAFTTWHEWAAIARIATLCVARRGPAAGLTRVAGATVVELQLPDLPESGTDIRRKAARGEDISSLVPPGVAGYIASHHLYTEGH
jgi:nicotinate-nucleotide adenylyltransferase